MASAAELPWPLEPVLCHGCERWVGRGRGVPFAPPGRGGAGPDAAEDPLESAPQHEPELDAPPREERLPRPSRPRPPRADAIEGHRARELGPPPVPTAFASSERRRPQEGGASHPAEPWDPAERAFGHGESGAAGAAGDAGFGNRTEAPMEGPDSLAPALPVERSGPDATAGYGNGAARPPHAGSYGPPAPEHTVAFPALTDERKRRRRFALPRLRRPTRAGVMRKLPLILVVAGVLLLLEGALTVLWKEPFSALFASQSQGALGDDLEANEREAAREAAKGRRNALQYMRRRAVSLNSELGPGEAVGRLRVKKIDLSTVVVQSTTEPSLTKGPGHYRETPLPGQKGNWTVGIAGHRTTYDAPFRNIDKLDRGDEIVFTLPYGRFTYEVEGTKIVDDSETRVFVPKGYDRIALTACHPLYSAAQRIIAYGKLKESKPRGGAKRVAAQS
jgi:sortase A